jgi:hypothetical protein
MNILNDFIIRVDTAVPETDKEQEIANLTSIINEKDVLIAKYTAELERLNSGIIDLDQELSKPAKAVPRTKTATRSRPSGKIKVSKVKEGSVMKSGRASLRAKKSTKKLKTKEE